MDNFLEIANRNQHAAEKLLKELRIETYWQEAGAKVNRVGSLKTGLLMHHLDIDLHVYTYPLSIEKSFSVISRIAQHPSVLRIQYQNGMKTEEHCLEWHLFCMDQEQREWQVDIIHIEPGSLYDGHFERVAEHIITSMTPQQKENILRIKYQTSKENYIPGIEYCYAVLVEGITNAEDFLTWKKNHAEISLINWMR